MFMFLSVSCNVILLAFLYLANKKARAKMEKREKIAMTLKKMLGIQVGLMAKEDCFANGAEIEIARYVRDVGTRCLEEGEYGEVDLKRMHPSVIKRYPDLFKMMQ